MFVFFFCKQKTAYDMRISDWSSDVCSSDLLHRIAAEQEIIEHALPDVFVEIGSKLWVRDAQGARRFHRPRSIDNAVLRVVEVVSTAEDPLSCTRKIVATHAPELGNARRPQGPVPEICWGHVNGIDRCRVTDDS